MEIVTTEILQEFVSLSRQWVDIRRGRVLLENAARALEQVAALPTGFLIYQKQLMTSRPEPTKVYSPWGDFRPRETELRSLAETGQFNLDTLRQVPFERWLSLDALPAGLQQVSRACGQANVSLWPLYSQGRHAGVVVLSRRHADSLRSEDHVIRTCVGQVSLVMDMLLAWRVAEESEKRYRSLFDHNSDAVFQIDINGKLVESNGILEKITGCTTAELRTREQRQALVLSETNRFFDHFEDPYSTEHVEVSILTKDGQEAVVLLNLVPILHDGNVTGHYAIVRDITERRKMEDWLQRTDKLSVLGQLAAGIAHEIRNPLTSLRGFIQLLGERQENGPYCEIMLPELDRINEIVSELLMVAKPESRNFRQNDLRSMVKEVLTLMTPQANLTNTRIYLSGMDQEIPFIQCDRNQIKQVFVNILGNSIEAMPNGGTIRISIEKSEDTVQVKISDEGRGIPPDRLSKLGEPFYTTKERGTGLGLMVSYQIIQSHSGQMTISSQIGAGTLVEITLPI